MAERFFIGPYKSGLIRDRKPFLVPDEAFVSLRNMYVWRDRVKKRFGSRLMNTGQDPSVQQLYSRFRVDIGTTDGAGNFAGSSPAEVTPAVGQIFSIGNTIFTVPALGNPVNLLIAGTATTATYNTTTRAVAITGSTPATAVYYYPALPVMGLLNREAANINDEEIVGFDTRYAYSYNSGTQWERFPGVAWTGNDLNFLWAANYRGATDNVLLMFVGNNNSADPLYYYDGSTFTSFSPVYNTLTNDKVLNARIGIPFQSRLVLLNTWEQVGGVATNFANRARFCQNGSPLQSDAWNQPPQVFGKGDFIDAPTSEAIISAYILKDRLIVRFERSTWELAYTGNQVVPFVWQTINVEFGAESTNSDIPFDKVILSVGDIAITSCNGANVERIDLNIPDEVFRIQNDNGGTQRVYGVRDYNIEMAYWAYPSSEGVATSTYPSKVFTYNYRNGAWAINDDSITCFGQYQINTSLTWNSTYYTWDELDQSWSDGVDIRHARNVIAGNQEGFTFIIDHNLTTNAYAISITEITESGLVATVTAINHNLNSGDYILIDFMQSTNDPNGTITAVNGKIYEILAETADTFHILIDIAFTPGALYAGAGVFRRISVPLLVTKQYNFYLDKGSSFTVNKIDMLVDKTPLGKVAVQLFAGTGDLVTDTKILSTAPYSSTFYPMEQYQESLWHTIYPNSFGSFLQFAITLTDNSDITQSLIRNVDVADSDFVLNAMMIYASMTASRLQ